MKVNQTNTYQNPPKVRMSKMSFGSAEAKFAEFNISNPKQWQRMTETWGSDTYILEFLSRWANLMERMQAQGHKIIDIAGNAFKASNPPDLSGTGHAIAANNLQAVWKHGSEFAKWRKATGN